MIGRWAFSAGLMMLLAECGFRPVYGEGGRASAELPAVYVGVIPNRAGQLVRQAIQARLEGADSGVAKRYTLSMAYYETEQILGTQANNFATRARTVGNATWTLHPAGDPAVVLGTGTVRSVDGYNLIDEQFFYQDLSEDAVQRRLAQTVAEQVALGLCLYFDKHPATR